MASMGFWKFAPLVAMGGVALAVGAWIVPIPGMGASAGDGGSGGGIVTPPVQVNSKVLPNIPEHDWSALYGPLMEVRTPYPTSTETGGDEPPPPPPPPPNDLLEGWHFAGTVTDSDGVLAIVSVHGDQRYFRIGQIVTLKDGVTTAEIVGVASDHVMVRVEAVDRKVTSDGALHDARTPAVRRGRTVQPNRSRPGGGS